MEEYVKKYIEGIRLNAPTTTKKIKEIEMALGISFPAQYREFMLESNGAEGAIGKKSFLAIWPIEDIIQYNEDYSVNEFNPGLVYFGSDRGGMAFAFDSRVKDLPVVTLPFISIDHEDLEVCGQTFNDFLQYLYNAD